MSASRFPHSAQQGKTQVVDSAPKAADQRFAYTRSLKITDRDEERTLRKKRSNRVLGIMDKSAAAINGELAREAAEAERRTREFWRNFNRKVKPQETEKPQPRKPVVEDDEPPIFFRRLPAYGHDIVDSMGLSGVFAEFKYHSARRTTYGVAKRLVYYVTKPESIEYQHDGSPAVLSNTGIDRDEMATAISILEDANRGARANAKVVITAIFQLPHEVTTETRLDIMREWADENLAVHDLPYVIGLHPPSPEGDQRNFHAHVVFSFRPVIRHGLYDWDVNRLLRTDLDDPAFFTILRSNFAQTMTHHVQKAGMTRTYTGLSNAARGLVNKPVQKMGAHKVRAFRDGEYVLDVDRTEALIAMNVRREMAYEALQNKVLEEIDMRFDDIASGAYYERHRPRPFLPIPAAKLGRPHRDRTKGVANSAAPVLVSPSIPVPAKIVTLPLVPKLLCPKPAAAAAENAPKTSLKLPVAFVLAATPPMASRKLLMPVRVIAPTLPVEPRFLQPMIPVDISTPDHKPQTLNLPSHVRAVKYENVRAQFLMPAKVSPPHLTSTKPMLPIAAGWSALPAQTQISKLKCPLSASPVSLAAQPPILKASTPAHVSPTPSERPSLRVPSPARPIPVKPSLAKPRIPVRAVLPQTNPHDTPLLVPIRSLSFPQLGTSITHPQKLMLPIRAAELSSGDAPREPLKIPISVVFIDPRPRPHELLEPRPFVMVHDEASWRAGKIYIAEDIEQKLNDAAQAEASTTSSPHASPRQADAPPKAAPKKPGGSLQQRVAVPTAIRSSPSSVQSTSIILPTAFQPIQTPQQLIARLKELDSFLIYDEDYDHLRLTKRAREKLNVNNDILHAPETNAWYLKQKAMQDQFLHAIIMKAGKPIRTPQDFSAIPFTSQDRERLNRWRSDPSCKTQLEMRILQITGTFKTHKPPAQTKPALSLEPQLYSRNELKNMIATSSDAGGYKTSLLDVLAQLPAEIYKFKPNDKSGYNGSLCGLMLRVGFEYWNGDPNISKIFNETIRLNKAKNDPFNPVYPPEVMIAMELHRREGYKPVNPKRALLCSDQTIVGGDAAQTQVPHSKTRSIGARDQRDDYGQGRDLDRGLQRDD